MQNKVGPRAVRIVTRSWLVILIALFATEYMVMLVLPKVLPDDRLSLFGAAIDALVVTFVLAPIIWWTLVRPLQEVIRLRTRFLSDLFSAIEAERRHTAYELHDGIGQKLSLLISGMRSANPSHSTIEQSARLDELGKLAQSALKEVRRIAMGLRPSLLDDLGLAIAVEKIVQDCRDLTAVQISLRTSSLGTTRLPDDVETAAFRIFQEAIANVIRHSEAAHAIVELNYQGSALELVVEDDGRGFDPKKGRMEPAEGGHMGLIGIRERVALLGGSFALDTAPGKGCRIRVALPVKERIHD